MLGAGLGMGHSRHRSRGGSVGGSGQQVIGSMSVKGPGMGGVGRRLRVGPVGGVGGVGGEGGSEEEDMGGVGRWGDETGGFA